MSGQKTRSLGQILEKTLLISAIVGTFRAFLKITPKAEVDI